MKDTKEFHENFTFYQITNEYFTTFDMRMINKSMGKKRAVMSCKKYVLNNDDVVL